MKSTKTLLALSVITALTTFAGSASAQTVDAHFYGRLDLSMTHSQEGYTTQNGKRGTVLENNFSHVGVKGSEQISDGIDLLYRAEFQVNTATDDKGSPFGARDTYLGLKTALGTVIVGRNDTVMKTSKGTAEAFVLTNAAYNRMIAGQDRKADGVTYYSPKILDLLTVNATYLLDDNYAVYDTKTGKRSDLDEKQYAASITAGDKKLKANSYYLAAAYNTIGGVDAYRGVAQYKIGQLKLGGLFQNTKSQSFDDKKGNSFFVSAVYNLNGVNLKAEVGKDKAGFGKYFKNTSGAGYSQATDVDINSIAVGADYRLAKSTLVYTHLAKYDGEFRANGAQSITKLDSDNVFTVGVRYDF